MNQRIRIHYYNLVTTILTPTERDDEGQTTAEYALVLAGVGGVVALFMAWAQKTGLVSSLFNAVFARLIGAVKS